MIGEEAYWTFEQALAFAIHLNVEKVGETPPFFALDDRSPEALKSLEALWSPKTFEALWALLRDLVAGKFHAIEHRQPVDRLQWLDRVAHLRQHERLVAGIGIRQFVAEVKKVTLHTLIPVADPLRTFPAPSEMREVAAPAQSKALTAVEPMGAAGLTPPKLAGKRLSKVEAAAAALLREYPDGRTADDYETMRGKLRNPSVEGAESLSVSDSTLKAALRMLGPDWRIGPH